MEMIVASLLIMAFGVGFVLFEKYNERKQLRHTSHK